MSQAARSWRFDHRQNGTATEALGTACLCKVRLCAIVWDLRYAVVLQYYSAERAFVTAPVAFGSAAEKRDSRLPWALGGLGGRPGQREHLATERSLAGAKGGVASAASCGCRGAGAGRCAEGSEGGSRRPQRASPAGGGVGEAPAAPAPAASPLLSDAAEARGAQGRRRAEGLWLDSAARAAPRAREGCGRGRGSAGQGSLRGRGAELTRPCGQGPLRGRRRAWRGEDRVPRQGAGGRRRVRAAPFGVAAAPARRCPIRRRRGSARPPLSPAAARGNGLFRDPAKAPGYARRRSFRGRRPGARTRPFREAHKLRLGRIRHPQGSRAAAPAPRFPSSRESPDGASSQAVANSLPNRPEPLPNREKRAFARPPVRAPARRAAPLPPAAPARAPAGRRAEETLRHALYTVHMAFLFVYSPSSSPQIFGEALINSFRPPPPRAGRLRPQPHRRR